jgi:glycosyltransferase involved in cell wall biosynthesis
MGTRSEASVSVVVPAYRAQRTLDACIDAILAQTWGGDLEVIVVASADNHSELPPELPDPRVKLITAVPRMPAAVARNHGVHESTGDFIAFTDADVVPARDWLASLVAACAEGDCVAGSVENGTPSSMAGTIEYWVEFLDLHPARSPATAWHGATCNLILPRAMWEQVGPFPTDMGGGEDTLLTARLKQEGHFRFAGDASVTHMNRTAWPEVLSHQYSVGMFTALLARRGPYKLRPLVRYASLAPVAVMGRVASVYGRIWALDRRSRARSIWLFPGVVIALICWGAGLVRGHVRQLLSPRGTTRFKT